MPFLEHLDELRSRLIWMGVTVLALSVAGFFIITELDVIGLLKRPIVPLVPEGMLLYTSPTEPMAVTLKLSFVVGIILSAPVLIYHIWGFLAPGVAMAYFLVLPLALQFLLGFQTQALAPIITIGEYLRFATRLILAFGIIFELPLVALMLSMLGLIDAGTLRKFRRHAIVAVSLLSALLTPADVGTMLMMMVPLLVLYEISVLLVALVDRRRLTGRSSPQAIAD
jgi:sec-independent protein translocase protein TatC